MGDEANNSIATELSPPTILDQSTISPDPNTETVVNEYLPEPKALNIQTEIDNIEPKPGEFSEYLPEPKSLNIQTEIDNNIENAGATQTVLLDDKSLPITDTLDSKLNADDYDDFYESGDEGEDSVGEDGGEDDFSDGEDNSDYLSETESEEEELLPLLSLMETVFEGNNVDFPKKGSMVRVHFKCMLENKTMIFDTRWKRKAMEFKVGVGQVIRGFEECLPRMSKGYGDIGLPPKIPPNATLVFDIELIKISPPDKYSSFGLRIDPEEDTDLEDNGDSSNSEESDEDGEDGEDGWDGEDGGFY